MVFASAPQQPLYESLDSEPLAQAAVSCQSSSCDPQLPTTASPKPFMR